MRRRTVNGEAGTPSHPAGTPRSTPRSTPRMPSIACSSLPGVGRMGGHDVFVQRLLSVVRGGVAAQGTGTTGRRREAARPGPAGAYPGLSRRTPGRRFTRPWKADDRSKLPLLSSLSVARGLMVERHREAPAGRAGVAVLCRSAGQAVATGNGVAKVRGVGAAAAYEGCEGGRFGPGGRPGSRPLTRRWGVIVATTDEMHDDGGPQPAGRLAPMSSGQTALAPGPVVRFPGAPPRRLRRASQPASRDGCEGRERGGGERSRRQRARQLRFAAAVAAGQEGIR
ncbi:hypothetical protein FHS42_006824 [Streptomyces zagrosensis]|uniref:Uncharacterized protein n=1 Tax=Streptomyces zagrosensis TaxID=1042984 RepID=A0A7W9QGB8_9ACTN|nr:hypothetical protein [Streptomyces zagrosensis]